MQSNDGGRTWLPAAPAPFPAYCRSLTATRSGHIIATTRYPHFSARVSHDRGRTWDPPVILGYAGFCNQTAVEVEPDVVIVTHMGDILKVGQLDSCIVRLRVVNGKLTLDH